MGHTLANRDVPTNAKRELLRGFVRSLVLCSECTCLKQQTLKQNAYCNTIPLLIDVLCRVV